MQDYSMDNNILFLFKYNYDNNILFLFKYNYDNNILFLLKYNFAYLNLEFMHFHLINILV